ncbi:MAG: GNAT family N-acetyltransferase [Clostridiaceae bacterium]|nr:GNAT family N-acetyltransferase [Clostridiaceae bacterium]
MLVVQSLSREQIAEIYDEHMVQDFPDNELKPLWAVEGLCERGLYHAYGLFDDDRLRGYALFSTAGRNRKHQNSLLLDYFAVIAGGRSRGYGSKFLKLLRPRLIEDFPNCQGMIAEVESVRAAVDPDEKHIRERRIAFYRRNGFRRTRIRSNLFGVAFTIMFQPFGQETAVQTDDAFVLTEMEKIYAAMLPAQVVSQQVKLWLKPAI